MSDLRIRLSTPEEASLLGPLTFPAYRHLLHLQPCPKLLDRGEQRTIQPVALVAELDGAIAGLAVGAMPNHSSEIKVLDKDAPEILSVLVLPKARRQGIAGRLIACLERHIETAGWGVIQTRYTLDPKTDHPVSKILGHQDWLTPVTYTLLFKCDLPNLRTLPVVQRMLKLRRSDSLVAVPWQDVTASQLEDLEQWNQQEPWIPVGVGPELDQPEPVDQRLSKGLIQNGRVVGWLLGHRMDEQTFRLTYAFIHPKLGRRAMIMPFWAELIQQTGDLGYRHWWWTVSAFEKDMYRFVRKHVIPDLPAGEVTESHQRYKYLSPSRNRTLPKPQPGDLAA